MIRLPILAPAALAALVVVSCGAPDRDPADLAAPMAEGGICRIGPDGGSLLAEQGIGGTGGTLPVPLPAPGAAPGTALPAPRPSDRGIGGTGVLGVITGFGSVCIDGLEVALDRESVVTMDGQPSMVASLRAGQIVSLVAADSSATPHTGAVSVRHEIVGTVRAAGSSGFVVAGQRVLVRPGTRGTVDPPSGSRVAVSGLRDALGAVVATRVDVEDALPGTPDRTDAFVVVRGDLARDADGLHLGGLLVRPAFGAPVPLVGPVTVTGRVLDGTLLAETLQVDLLARDPPTYFGSGVQRYLIESYVDPGGHLVLGRGLYARGASPGTPSVVAFEQVQGTIVAASVRTQAEAAALLAVPGRTANDTSLFPARSQPAGGGTPAASQAMPSSLDPARQPGTPEATGPSAPGSPMPGVAGAVPTVGSLPEGFAPAPVPGSGPGFGGSNSVTGPPSAGGMAARGVAPSGGLGAGPGGGAGPRRGR